MRIRRHAAAAATALLLVSVTPWTSITPGAQAAPSKIPDKADAQTEFITATYRFENDGTGSAVTRMRFRVLTEAGRRGLGQLIRAYDEVTSTLAFDYVRTKKADGRVVEADPKSARDVNSSEMPGGGAALTDVRFKVVSVPDLAVGDTVEVGVTERLLKPSVPGEFFAFHDAQAGFVDRETVELDLPATRAVALRVGPGTHTVETKDGRTIHRWVIERPGPPDRKEKRRPFTFAVSSFESWERFGTWIRGLFDAAAAPTPELAELAARLTLGKTTDRERARALFAYATGSIRYTALLFNGHGYRPHALSDVMRNGYGDCKDKHLLFAALLRAAGLKTGFVLLEAGRDMREPDVPLPLQFNHVITAFEVDGQREMADATLPGAPLGQLPAGLRGTKGLLVDADGARVVTLPSVEVPQYERATMKGTLAADGSLEITSTTEMSGDVAVGARTVTSQGSQAVLKSVAETIAHQVVSGSELKDFSAGDADPYKPSTLAVTLRKDSWLNPLDVESTVDMPRSFLGSTAVVDDDDEDATSEESLRVVPATSRENTETLEIQLPPGTKVTLPLPVHIANELGSYESQYAFADGRFTARRSLVVRNLRALLLRHREFEPLRQIIKRDEDQRLTIVRAGGAAADVLAGLDADKLNAIGTDALQAGKFEAALPALLEATRKDPKHMYAFNNLARAYLGLGRLDDAERAARRQIEVNALDQWAYANLGEALRRRKKPAEALEMFKKQLEVNPFDAFVHQRIAFIYGEQGKLEEARAALEQGLKAKKDDPMLMGMLVELLGRMGRTAEAKQLLQRMVAAKAADAGSFPLDDGQLRALGESLEYRRSAMPNVRAGEVDLDGPQLDEMIASSTKAVKDLVKLLAAQTKPDKDFTQPGQLAEMARHLDQVGQGRARRHDLAGARAALEPALAISFSQSVAEHLCGVLSEAGAMDDALVAYAWATAGGARSVERPKALGAWLKSHWSSEEQLRQKLSSILYERVKSRGLRNMTWPKNLDTGWKSGLYAKVRILVDEKGAVIAAEGIKGENPALATAIADAKKLKFPVLVVEGTPLRTTRTVTVTYTVNGNIEATWGFGTDPIGEFAGGIAASLKR